MKRNLSFSILLIPGANISRRQTSTVSGRVISARTKQPLSGGVTIRIIGNQSGTSTDHERKYSIPIPNQGNLALFFSQQTFTNAFAMGFITGKSELMPVQQTQRNVISTSNVQHPTSNVQSPPSKSYAKP